MSCNLNLCAVLNFIKNFAIKNVYNFPIFLMNLIDLMYFNFNYLDSNNNNCLVQIVFLRITKLSNCDRARHGTQNQPILEVCSSTAKLVHHLYLLS